MSRSRATLCLGIAFVALAVANGSAGERSAPSNPSQIALTKAIEDPFDEGRFEALLAVLPRDGERYVVEGDVVLTREEVRAYLVSRSGAATKSGIHPELVVGLHEGKRDYYADPATRTLRYRIERDTFASAEDADNATKQMREATADWERACADCGIHFVEETGTGDAPWPAFRVRLHDVHGAYIAAAFFPHQIEADRVINIDPSFFRTKFDRAGVLRHELGHVLGYRHEQIRGVAGCAGESGAWLPLTPYDPHSVMHYFCGGGGSMRLDITEIDRIGHHNLYDTRQTSAEPHDDSRPSDVNAAMVEPDPGGGLPRVGEYRIVEGDLPMTEQEFRAYTVSQSVSSVSVAKGQEMMVNLYLGRPDIYTADPISARRLTYAIDRGSFGGPDDGRYRQVVEAMEQAGKDWVDACFECGIRFVHVQDADSAPSTERVNFVVRLDPTIHPATVLGFFPSDKPARRVIRIHPRAFDGGIKLESIFRHELGHALGYRHATSSTATRCHPDDGHRDGEPPKSPAESAMQAFCGNETGLELPLTPRDRNGHRRLYEPPLQLSAQLEGGDVGANALKILHILNGRRALATREILVAPGDTVEGIMSRALGLPADPALVKIAREFNRGLDPSRTLDPGRTINVPDVRFQRYTYGRRLDTNDQKQQKVYEQSQRGPLVDRGTPDQTPNSKGVVRVSLVGFSLRHPVPDKETLAGTIDAINKLKSANIVVGARTPRDGQPNYYTCSPPCPCKGARQFWSEHAPTVPAPMQGSLRSVLGVDVVPPSPHPCRRDSSNSNCPEVVIVDNLVSAHEDLRGGIIEGTEFDTHPTLVVNGNSQPFNARESLPEGEHGTHLAGIVGARDNDYGFVGVDPTSRIRSWNWDQLSDQTDDLTDKISTLEGERHLDNVRTIYLFATNWKYRPFNDRQTRITDNALAKRIDDEKILVVAAAGQPETGKPEDISWKSETGPMNLGDLENVLVVTACDPCEGPTATIASWANYSTDGFVHVAAPGVNIPSTSGRAEYAIASGTSQAAAFVAGAASLLASAYPDSYDDAYLVKSRLQLTATPFPTTGGNTSGSHIAAGVLDLSRALLNPKQNWLRKTGQPFAALGLANAKWKVRSIDGRDDSGGGQSINLRQISRILKVGTDYVFFTEGPQRGVVKHTPPIRFQAQALEPVVLAGLRLADIEELILAHPLGAE